MTAPGDATNRRSAPIGVFDSGLGGLSVVRQLQTELPRESLLYIADSLYCPYGVRSVAEICMRSRLLVGDLVAAGVKMVVVACNTASAAAIDLIRAEFEIPIVAMEPAVKPAITLTTSGKIAVLATPRTASSERLQLLIQRWGTGIDIRAIGVPGLADLVEAGEWSGPGVASLLVPIVAAQVTDGVDVIVLGCTHYPFAQEPIRATAGPDVRIIASGNAVARR
ncbi:MAG TPA: glutamate racemase, partial [Thermomicrobiales bacterium]|nr:glutamate racemase [Thermomicrobiales bacterium]